VHFQYVNVIPDPHDPLIPHGCIVSDRIEYLTPGDTLSVLTTCHNPSFGSEGYLVVVAEDPLLQPMTWSHNFLVGSELVINSVGGMYSLNAIPFRSMQPSRTATDRDGDDQCDFDGIEFEPLPDHLMIDSFLALEQSSLTLLNLTGTLDFEATLAFDIWNDNEYSLSATVRMGCWIEEQLENLSPIFTYDFLKLNTPHDQAELDLDCDGMSDIETGWVRIRGLQASSPGQTIPNPSLLGAVTAGVTDKIDGGHLLWESKAKQPNGDFYRYGTFDPEFPD